MNEADPPVEPRRTKENPARGLRLSPGRTASLACLLELSASKPGNVNRSNDFFDTTFTDFVRSAVVLGQTIDDSIDLATGKLILRCVENNLQAVGKNTNLGMVLLLCPLAQAAAAEDGMLNSAHVGDLLRRMDSDDSRNVFDAIRLAKPGGLGRVSRMDIRDSAPENLLAAMQLAADRDLVAQQYVDDFALVFESSQTHADCRTTFPDYNDATVFTHVNLMARFPDSLIGRKCGDSVARRSQRLAQLAIDGLTESVDAFWQAVGELDFWCRSDRNRRNPGTTADLIAAILFVDLWNTRQCTGQRHATPGST